MGERFFWSARAFEAKSAAAIGDEDDSNRNCAHAFSDANGARRVFAAVFLRRW